MRKGFFSTSKIQKDRKTSLISHCGLCGLYKHCKSPKMPATGKGRKNILVAAEAPGREEDLQNKQLVGKVGKFFRKEFLKPLGIDLDLDCIKTNSIICRPRNNKKPDDNMIEACYPNLAKTIKKYNPNVILLLGDAACKSLLSKVWKKGVGSISRWAGFCIPCTNPNVWIVLTYHPSYVLRKHDTVLNKIYRKHLKLAISKCKNKPWQEIPDYKKEIEIIIRPSQAAKLIKEMTKRGGVAAFDYETNCKKPEGEGTEIVSCSICWRGKRTISYPWQGEAIESTSNFIKSPIAKIASNLNFEDRWTRVKLGHRVNSWYWDTMVAAHVLDNRKDITGLKFQSFVWLGMPSYDEHIRKYLKATKKSKFNQIKELDLRDLLLYGGFDSYCEYWIAMKQIEAMNKRFRNM
jgi:DNA polymerase